MKKLPLWQWGLICIGGGVGAAIFSGLLGTPAGNSAEAQGEALGRGIAVALFWIVGIVLIGIHFVRNARARKNSQDKP
jgi:hypothetical protein